MLWQRSENILYKKICYNKDQKMFNKKKIIEQELVHHYYF